MGFSCTRGYWFARLFDETKVDTVPTIEITLVDGQAILEFIKLYADQDCPHVEKVRTGITDNLAPRVILA